MRVPLEKEVPLSPVIEEPKPFEEKPEFPELSEVRIQRLLMCLCGALPVLNNLACKLTAEFPLLHVHVFVLCVLCRKWRQE